MKRNSIPEFNAEQQKEIVAWIDQNRATFPEPVRVFLEFHHQYLAADGNACKSFDSTYRELRRALGITPSSEKRPSNSRSAIISPDSQFNNKDSGVDVNDPRKKLENELERTTHLRGWHGKLHNRHKKRVKRIKEKLAKMSEGYARIFSSAPPRAPPRNNKLEP